MILDVASGSRVKGRKEVFFTNLREKSEALEFVLCGTRYTLIPLPLGRGFFIVSSKSTCVLCVAAFRKGEAAPERMALS